MKATIAVLPGDGIGVEVTAEAQKVLTAVAEARGHTFVFETGLVGGAAIDAVGVPLPDETLTLCQAADAILFGAAGGPKWDDPRAAVRPEQGLLSLRKGLGLYANLRPVKLNPVLINASTIKPEVLQGTDLIVVRELTGGLYFGERGRKDGGNTAYDTMIYTVPEIERVARAAFRLAAGRRRHVTSVDKANVLESSRLWRETVTRVAAEFPDITLEHLLVDACAMHLIRRPSTFDVIVTENMFGDILTDEASMLAGSMGMLPSASLAEGSLGLYEPIHGSAPDIAGQDMANPLAAILSAALLLRYSLGLEEEAIIVEAAVDRALAEGYRTPDIAEPDSETLGTRAMGDLIAHLVAKS
ncbi:MAG TPA: 3-isopropylmalate dehydrogenase [Chloroflexi bacterium]|jgi:3-isopropylmalate dehydrogenase|nr:3-isopropylmalate dehydrogenase [Chloroflexota bacterium]